MASEHPRAQLETVLQAMNRSIENRTSHRFKLQFEVSARVGRATAIAIKVNQQVLRAVIPVRARIDVQLIELLLTELASSNVEGAGQHRTHAARPLLTSERDKYGRDTRSQSIIDERCHPTIDATQTDLGGGKTSKPWTP